MNKINLESKSSYQGVCRKACENQNLRHCNDIEKDDFVKIYKKLECGDAKDILRTSKKFASDYNSNRTRSDTIPLSNDRVVNEYQIYTTDRNQNKLDRHMKSSIQRIPRRKSKSIDKNFVLSSLLHNNKNDNIKHNNNLKLNSDHIKPVDSKTKNKNSSVLDEIRCYFQDLLSSSKSNKYSVSRKDFANHKVNNKLKQRKSSTTNICNNSITISDRSNITNNTVNECKGKVNVNTEYEDKLLLDKLESKNNTIPDDYPKGQYIDLDKYINFIDSEERSENFRSKPKNEMELFPYYAEKNNPFQFKLNNDIVCFLVNLRSNKDGMCFEWARKNELHNKRKCKNKSKPKNKCINYKTQLNVTISDDCVINNSLYKRSKQYFKDISSKLNKCLMPQRLVAICAANNNCFQAGSRSNNIICEYKTEKQKTPSKSSVELENKKSSLKQNRSCNTSQCCEPRFKSRFITAVKSMFKSKNCCPDINKTKLDGSMFKLKIDPCTMRVINKREVIRKLKSQNKKLKKNCNSTTATNLNVKGKACCKNEITPTASDCKGPIFEIKLNRNNMKILNLSEIIQKICRLDCSRQANNVQKPRVQNRATNRCDAKQLRDIQSKISCLWTQFSCGPQNTGHQRKHNNFNVNRNYRNTFGIHNNYRTTRRKVIKSISEKSKVRKMKKHKREKLKRVKQHKKKVNKKIKKVHLKKIVQRRKKDKLRKAKTKKNKDKCRKLKEKRKSEIKKKLGNTCCMEFFKYLADVLFCYSKSSKPKCEKPRKRKRKRCEHIKYHCKVGHLRKSDVPCMWLYIVCPSLYPTYQFFRSMLRNLGYLLLIMLALVMWCPFVLAFELCRILCCLR